MKFLRDHAVTIVIALIGAVVNIGTFRAAGESTARTVTDHEARIRSMEGEQKFSVAIKEQTDRLNRLGEIVKADHEVVIKLSTVTEAYAKIIQDDHDAVVRILTILEKRDR